MRPYARKHERRFAYTIPSASFPFLSFPFRFSLVASNPRHSSNIDMTTEPITRRNPSYCFVDFESEEIGEKARTELNGKLLRGRPVRINWCVKKRTAPRDGEVCERWRAGAGEEERVCGVEDTATAPSTILDATPRRESEQFASARDSPSSAGEEVSDEGELSEDTGLPSTETPSPLLPLLAHADRRVFIGSLPLPLDQHTAEAAIRDLLKGFRIANVSKVKSPRNATAINGDSRTSSCAHYAFVDFVSPEEARRVVRELDGVDMPWGRRLRVKMYERRLEGGGD